MDQLEVDCLGVSSKYEDVGTGDRDQIVDEGLVVVHEAQPGADILHVIATAHIAYAIASSDTSVLGSRDRVECSVVGGERGRRGESFQPQHAGHHCVTAH